MLLGVGAAISVFTGRPALRNGLRMLVIAALAAGATYGVGRLVGLRLRERVGTSRGVGRDGRLGDGG